MPVESAKLPTGNTLVVAAVRAKALGNDASMGLKPRAARPKIPNLKWARGSGPGPGTTIGSDQGRYGLRGLGDADGEAERLDLADVVAELTAGVGAGGVVTVAEVGVPGGRVG